MIRRIIMLTLAIIVVRVTLAVRRDTAMRGLLLVNSTVALYCAAVLFAQGVIL